MGKSSKSSERRARIEQLERERKAAERKRLWLFSGVVGVIAVIIIGVTGWTLWSEQQREAAFADQDLAAIGAPASAAGCSPAQQVPATAADHIAPPQPIPYDASPPASGPHRPNWAPFERKFYTAEDRPELGMLVHNLEHGYNILWYDESVANDSAQLSEVEGLASKFEGSARDPNKAFIAVPWTADDGEPFPGGKHLALTHWYADPQNPDAPEQAVTQYCAKLSGEVVGDFMQEWQQSEAREGGPAFL